MIEFLTAFILGWVACYFRGLIWDGLVFIKDKAKKAVGL